MHFNIVIIKNGRGKREYQNKLTVNLLTIDAIALNAACPTFNTWPRNIYVKATLLRRCPI